MAKEEKQQQATFSDELGISPTVINEAKKVAKLCFECGDVPVIISETGTGKSQMARQIAAEMGWKAVFLFLAHLEPEDIGGIPYPNGGDGTYHFLCEKSIKQVIDSNTPTLLVLDEWNRGEKNVMNAAFTLMEDRRFGGFSIPDHVKIMACMNPSDGNYLVNEAEKDPAFRRRLCFVSIQPDPVSLLEYMSGPGNFHHYVVDYLRAVPSAINDEQSRRAGKIAANPASWEKISRTCYQVEKGGMSFDKDELTIKTKLAGHIGYGPASAFLSWVKDNEVLINPDEVIYQYKKVQKKVQKLVNSGKKSTEIGDLVNGVAITMVAKEEKSPEVCKNIGMFMCDLPLEFVKTLAQLLDNIGTEQKKVNYTLEISTGLSQTPEFQEAFERIQKSEQLIEERKQQEKDEEEKKPKTKKSK